MKQKLSTFFSDTFVRHNVVFFIGSITVAFFNYAYYPVLGRIVSIQNFGDLGTVISLLGQAGIIFGIFGQVARHAIIHAKENEANAIQGIYSTALFCISATAFGLILFNIPLTSLLHFQSIYSLPAFALLLVLNVPSIFLQAILLAKLHFKISSVASGLMSLGRLVFAVILIKLGFGVTGAIVGLMISQLIFILYAYSKVDRQFKLTAFEWPGRKLFSEETPYAFLIFLSTGLVSLLYNSDIIAVKYFFPATEAGLYVGISTIANILFFITASISGVLLSHINRHTSFKQNHLTMMKALLLTLGIGGSTCIIFSLFPYRVISLLIGQKYLSFGSYLPSLCFLIFIVSLINLFVSYFISLREFKLLYVCFVGLIAFASIVYSLHSSIRAIITGYTVASCVSLLLLIGFYVYYWSSHRQTA